MLVLLRGYVSRFVYGVCKSEDAAANARKRDALMGVAEKFFVAASAKRTCKDEFVGAALLANHSCPPS